MKRDLDAMTRETYDLVVVGGGITGACIARDAAMRGLRVALVDKADFAGATTAASSKLIHGGLRYLANMELRLVRESLRERRIWSTIAPHMVDLLTFLIPTTSDRKRERVLQGIGLRLYDWLAYDRNRLEDPEKLIPKHKKYKRDEALALEPGLAAEDLTGALEFYDYQMYSPERLALECILDGASHGADCANYAEVTSFVREDDRITGVRVRDNKPTFSPKSTGENTPRTFEIRGHIVVNAGGPWADFLMRTATGTREVELSKSAARKLIRSKGIHLVTRSLTNGHAITVSTLTKHFFILPWRGHSLLGTTDTAYANNPDDVHVTEREIVDFVTVVNKGYPGAKLRRSDVLHFYAGLRPLIASKTTTENDVETDTYSASRGAEIYDHESKEGLRGLITAIGGKWTTSRNLAEQVIDLATAKLGRPATPCMTDRTPTYGGHIGRFADFCANAIAKHPDWPADVVENLARNYGNRMEDVLAIARTDEQLGKRVCETLPDIAAEIVHAVRFEMALTLEDVLFRRTGLGTLGSPGDATIAKVTDLMARDLGWDSAARASQIKQANARFAPKTRTRAIVNPLSWGGLTGKHWPNLEMKMERITGPLDTVLTDKPMAATDLTRQALKEGMEQIISVGGDGTINEVVNGFFENGALINPDAMLTVVSSGTGRDFRRTFGIPEKLEDQIERLSSCQIRPIDIGKVTYTNENGIQEIRYFDNVASFGLSGAADRAVNRAIWAKKINAKYAFQWGVFKAFARYKMQPVRLQIDDEFDEVINAFTVAICNGQFFGAGMRIAPPAEPDDGLFHVVVIADIGKIEFLRCINSVYRGEHLSNPHVRIFTARKVTASPAPHATKPVLLDIDGESPGQLPATFEILPKAIYLRS